MNEIVCYGCKKPIVARSAIKAEPVRHMTSPQSFNHGRHPDDAIFNHFCSQDCKRKTDKEQYAFFADLDRNASDSECFVSEGMDGSYRVGHCKITGDRVRVQPLCPGHNSGQPQACVDHFILRESYRKFL